MGNVQSYQNSNNLSWACSLLTLYYFRAPHMDVRSP